MITTPLALQDWVRTHDVRVRYSAVRDGHHVNAQQRLRHVTSRPLRAGCGGVAWGEYQQGGMLYNAVLFVCRDKRDIHQTLCRLCRVKHNERLFKDKRK